MPSVASPPLRDKCFTRNWYRLGLRFGAWWWKLVRSMNKANECGLFALVAKICAFVAVVVTYCGYMSFCLREKHLNGDLNGARSLKIVLAFCIFT